MNQIKPFIIRLLFVAIPLLLLYFYAQIEFKANMQKEHPTDVGFGIAILLVFILIILFIGFLVDFIKNLRRKQYKIARFDFFLLLLFTIPVLYIGCLMKSRECFCGWLINTINFFI